MTKRRQNHSCEPCRKSKKACDGYLINSDQAFLANAALYSDSDREDFRPTAVQLLYANMNLWHRSPRRRIPLLSLRKNQEDMQLEPSLDTGLHGATSKDPPGQQPG